MRQLSGRPPEAAPSPAVAVPEGSPGDTTGSELASVAATGQRKETPTPAAKPAPPLPDGYLIQLGVFGAMTNADALRAEVEARGLAARDRLRREGLPAGLVVPPRKGSPVVRAGK